MEKTLHLLTLLIISGWDCEKYCPKTDQHSRITITGLDSPPRTQIRGTIRVEQGAVLVCSVVPYRHSLRNPLVISCLTLRLFGVMNDKSVLGRHLTNKDCWFIKNQQNARNDPRTGSLWHKQHHDIGPQLHAPLCRHWGRDVWGKYMEYKFFQKEREHKRCL